MKDDVVLMLVGVVSVLCIVFTVFEYYVRSRLQRLEASVASCMDQVSVAQELVDICVFDVRVLQDQLRGYPSPVSPLQGQLSLIDDHESTAAESVVVENPSRSESSDVLIF